MWFSFRTRLTHWENQHYVERNLTKTAWLWGHRATTRHSLEVQIVAKRVGMHAFLDAGALGGFLTRVPDCFGIDRSILAKVAGEQPGAGFAVVATPVGAQCR